MDLLVYEHAFTSCLVAEKTKNGILNDRKLGFGGGTKLRPEGSSDYVKDAVEWMI